MVGTNVALAIAYGPGPITEQKRNPAGALDQVLERFGPALYRMALRYSRNPADAEDALQDALLSAVCYIGEFEGRSQLSTWLTKIVINAARMQFRRHHRHETVSIDQSAREEGPTYADSLMDYGPSPEETCKETELRQILGILMKRLPKSQRMVFQLRELDGLSTREAAHKLGLSQGTVKTQLARARSKLGALFTKYLPLAHPKHLRERRPRRRAVGVSMGSHHKGLPFDVEKAQD